VLIWRQQEEEDDDDDDDDDEEEEEEEEEEGLKLLTRCRLGPRRLRALIDRESCILCHPQIPGARSAGTWTRHQSREEIGPKKWTKIMRLSLVTSLMLSNDADALM